MAVIQNRRELITGLIAFAAAPAIVRASSLMPVKQMVPLPLTCIGFTEAMKTWTARFEVNIEGDGTFGVKMVRWCQP